MKTDNNVPGTSNMPTDINVRDYYIAEARRMRSDAIRRMARRVFARLRPSTPDHGARRPAHAVA